MAAEISATIHYDLTYTHEKVRPLFASVSDTVNENWMLGKGWTFALSPHIIDVNSWMTQITSKEWSDGYLGGKTCKFQYFEFKFSPLTWRPASLLVQVGASKCLSVTLSVSSHVTSEILGDRELERMEAYEREHPELLEKDEWWDKKALYKDTENIGPFHLWMLRRIVEQLLAIYPIRSSELGYWLDPTKHDPDKNHYPTT